jgi:four helix bundle protein
VDGETDDEANLSMINSHEDLEVWRKSIEMVDLVYDLCQDMPAAEKFGLISQLQRAAVSVPANIAEGCGRESTRDLLRHLSIAMGSLAEVRTLLVIVKRRSFASDSAFDRADAMARTVARLLIGLQRSLRKKLNTSD